MASEDHVTAFSRAVDACMRGALEPLQDVISNNPKLATHADPLGNTLLHWAATGGYVELVQLLLASSANVRCTPLFPSDICPIATFPSV